MNWRTRDCWRTCWHDRWCGHDDPSTEYGGALLRGFGFAHDLGVTCEPVHFLVGIAEGDGPAAALLGGTSRSLRAVVTDGRAELGHGAIHLSGQVQGAAAALVDQLGEPGAPEHLLVAVIDQGTPQAITVLRLAGIDPAAARAAALAGLGVNADLPSVTMPALTPAGTLDRPALPITELDPRAWSVLRWRQDHLPVGRVRGRSSSQGICAVEQRAAWRLPARLGLDEDQRYSLLHHHRIAVEQHLTIARPDLAPLPRQAQSQPGLLHATSWPGRRRRRPRLLRFTAGWGTWFGNRRVGIRDRWFRFTTLHHYRHAPHS